jgi:F0F1-type ATP synthase membrane subunit a
LSKGTLSSATVTSFFYSPNSALERDSSNGNQQSWLEKLSIIVTQSTRDLSVDVRIFVIAALFALSCTASQNFTAKRSDLQTVREALLSGIQYSLQDLEDMDREDMDRAFFTNEPNLHPKKLTAK